VKTGLALWDIRPPARRGEDTQAAGAAAISTAAPRLRGKVLAMLRARGSQGATIEEISELIHARICTVCGRIGELRMEGLVTDSGQRRPGRSGVRAKVFTTIRGWRE
jgi:hypothetical protein